jgi:hypothetical protein
MVTVGNLGSVEYDIVANDKASAGLLSVKNNFVVTAGDIVNAIKSVAGALEEFDAKNSELNSNLGITALTLGMNAEELRGWAAELSGPKDSIIEVSGVIDELARAGIRNHDAMIETANGFDVLADAVGVPTDLMTAQMIPAFKAMGISLQDVALYSDVLAYTMNSTGVTVSDFTMAVKRAGPELAAAGVTMDDLAALMVILKDRGYEGRNMMAELTAATSSTSDANKDGKVSLDEMLASMKISNEELTTTKKRVEDASVGYAAQAQQINDKNKPIQEQYNTTLDNTVLSLGALTTPLTNAGSLFGSLATTISAVAIPAMLLFPAQFAAIGASITTALGGLGTTLSAAGTALAGSLVAAVGAGILLGLGGVWVLLKTGLLDGISDLGRWVETSPIGSVIMNALKIVLAPVGSLGAGIIALVKGDFEGIGDAMMQPLNQAGDSIRFFVDSVRNMFLNFGSGFSGLVGQVQGVFSGIGSAFYGMAGQIQGVFSQMMNAIHTLISSSVGGFVNLGMNIITALVSGIVSAAGNIPAAIGGSMTTVANSAVSAVKSIPIVGSMVGALGFAEGGIVPGPTGAPVSAIVHGGERVIPVGGGTAGDTFNFTINGAGQNAEEIANMVIQKFSQARAQKGYRTG